MERVVNNSWQLLIGIVALMLGVAVYLLVRPAWQFTLMPDFLFIQWLPADYFGQFGSSLPSYLHVFGMSMLCAGIIATSKKAYLVICISWALINILFEVLQADHLLLQMVLDPSGIQVSDYAWSWLENYALNAVFDYYDILAVLLGAMSAYWMLEKTDAGED